MHEHPRDRVPAAEELNHPRPGFMVREAPRPSLGAAPWWITHRLPGRRSSKLSFASANAMNSTGWNRGPCAGCTRRKTRVHLNSPLKNTVKEYDWHGARRAGEQRRQVATNRGQWLVRASGSAPPPDRLARCAP